MRKTKQTNKQTNKKKNNNPRVIARTSITGKNEIRLANFMSTNNKTKVKRKILQAYNHTHET